MRRERRAQAFPSARIKKIMQVDQDVGKIGSATPSLVGKALECLIEDLLSNAAATALERRAKTVQPAHLKVAVNSHDVFDFLRPTFHDVTDVIPEEKKKRARPRAPTPPPAASVPTDVSSPLPIPPLKMQCVMKRVPATSPIAIVPPVSNRSTASHTAKSITDIMLTLPHMQVQDEVQPQSQSQVQTRDIDEDEDYDEELEHQPAETPIAISQPKVPSSTTCARVAVHALVS